MSQMALSEPETAVERCPTCGYDHAHEARIEELEAEVARLKALLREQVRDPSPGKTHRFDPPTSWEAALNNSRVKGTQLWQVFIAIAKAGRRGRTYDELVVQLGTPSAQQRLSDLKDASYVIGTGETRPTRRQSPAEIYVLSPKGEAAYDIWSTP